MLSYLLPSMNRCESLKRTVQSLLDTSPINDTEYCVVIDVDEKSNNEIVALLSKYKANYKVDFSLEKRGALKAWNWALNISSGDLLLPLGDDHLAHAGWYEKTIAAHRDILGNYGMVAVNDLMFNGADMGTTLIFDRKFCKDVLGGVVTYYHYKYYCVDNELNARAKAVNRYYWCQDAVIEHLQPGVGKRPYDDSDRERLSTVNEDIAMFERRKSLGFPNDFESVI